MLLPPWQITYRKDFSQFFEAYQAALASENALDFDDMILRCVELLEAAPHVVSHIAHVLVDEFQVSQKGRLLAAAPNGGGLQR